LGIDLAAVKTADDFFADARDASAGSAALMKRWANAESSGPLSRSRNSALSNIAFSLFDQLFELRREVHSVLSFDLLPWYERLAGVFRDGALQMAKVFQVVEPLAATDSSHGFDTPKSLQILSARKSIISRWRGIAEDFCARRFTYTV
jgi:hypothetical protein